MGWSEKNLGVSDGWPFNGEVDVSFPKKCSPWKKSFFEKLSSLLGRDVLHIGSLLEVISLSSLPPDQLQLETPQFLEKKTLLGCDKRPNVRVKSPVVKCWIPSCHGWLHLHVDVSVENLTALPKIPILVKNKELCHPKLLPPRILFITYWLVVWTYPSNFFLISSVGMIFSIPNRWKMFQTTNQPMGFLVLNQEKIIPYILSHFEDCELTPVTSHWLSVWCRNTTIGHEKNPLLGGSSHQNMINR